VDEDEEDDDELADADELLVAWLPFEPVLVIRGDVIL
jgi:hypothetical protein